MKSDSIKKSVIKEESEIITSKKKNLEKENDKGRLVEDKLKSEENIKSEGESLDLEEYPNFLNKLLNHPDWIKQNDNINILKNNFENKFQSELQKKKNEFINKGGNEIDFYFTPPYKKKFYDLIKNYKYKKNQYFKELSNKQTKNLVRKREIIEEIKNLIDKSQHDNNTYKKFKILQEEFYSTGQVPRSENNNIWQTYKFHVERFYDLLHLNRELRDFDYKNNYEEKIKIIEKAEKLSDLSDIHTAIRELNNLHRLWKNELGPVPREKREELWHRFQKATKKIHEQKNQYIKNIDSIKLKNYELKMNLIEKIKKISESQISNHNKWQNSIQKVDELKKKFIDIGNVPRNKNKDLWNSFREVTRTFNKEKNNFYKNIKILEKKSLESKQKLIEEVENILNNEDWRIYIKRIKEIQIEWKNTGRVSKKYSERMWSKFRSITNNYFEKYKNKSLNKKEIEIIEKQKEFINNLKTEKIPLTPKRFESFIIEKSNVWSKIRNNDIGNQEKNLLKFLNDKWNEISIPKNKLDIKKYQTKLYFIQNDKNLINEEHKLLRKKVEEITNELNQLENNLEFFSESSTNNPLLVEVNDKIKELNSKKLLIKSKLTQLKSVLNQTLKEVIKD